VNRWLRGKSNISKVYLRTLKDKGVI